MRPGVSRPNARFRSGITVYVFRGRFDRTGKHGMEHLTADESRPQEVPADTTSPEPQLDHALAGAIRRLIAGARDPVPEPMQKVQIHLR
jgi:hypothetical protein